ncbi:MAG: BA14K family protein [Alphaproteobacteria bacterium]|nr:BA14K family protein [Alphaproteobacteria bacterium]
MRTARTAAFAIALTLACASPFSVSAGARQDVAARDDIIRDTCKEKDARDCKDYRANGVRWSASQYKGFYNRHLAANADPEVARLFGVEPGKQAASNEDKYATHTERCAARHAGYDPKTDSYPGADGKLRPCNL